MVERWEYYNRFTKMKLQNAQNIYISGIGGIGVSALAQLLLHRGCTIFGSDLEENHVTKLLVQKGISIIYTQDAQTIPADIDFHIYSPAVPDNNPERTYFHDRNIPSLSYPSALAEITKEYHTIAISGTNGKTTTTAMIGHILEEVGADPTVIVGSFVPKWGSNFRAGNSKYLVIEACEHQAHMNQFHTQDIVITNIEEDHLDYYKDINDIIKAFQAFVDNVATRGNIILNADDKYSNKLSITNNQVTNFGIQTESDFQASTISISNGKQHFSISDIQCELSIPGQFNIQNALAATALCSKLGITINDSAKALRTFNGTWRRFERLGTYNNNLIISDYAHHPSAIRATLQAVKEFYPDKKILLVFQPHQHNRTKNLFNDFIHSFDNADCVILPEIFDVAGREEIADQTVSSQDIVHEVKKQKIPAYFGSDFTVTKELIDVHLFDDGILLIMGAGDVYKIAEELATY